MQKETKIGNSGVFSLKGTGGQKENSWQEYLVNQGFLPRRER